MGGCPTNTTDGNLSETDAETTDPSTFQYTVPSDFAPGDYTLGVTWFNRVGNREMYMFCAPVTLTGGSGKKRGVEVRKAASRSKEGWVNKRANYPDLFKYVLLQSSPFPLFTLNMAEALTFSTQSKHWFCKQRLRHRPLHRSPLPRRKFPFLSPSRYQDHH